MACATPVTQSEIAQAKFPPQPKQTEIDKELNAYPLRQILMSQSPPKKNVLLHAKHGLENLVTSLRTLAGWSSVM